MAHVSNLTIEQHLDDARRRLIEDLLNDRRDMPHDVADVARKLHLMVPRHIIFLLGEHAGVFNTSALLTPRFKRLSPPGFEYVQVGHLLDMWHGANLLRELAAEQLHAALSTAGLQTPDDILAVVEDRDALRAIGAGHTAQTTDSPAADAVGSVSANVRVAGNGGASPS